MIRRAALAAMILLVVACDAETPGEPDAGGVRDAGATGDAGADAGLALMDAGTPRDGGPIAVDAGRPDGGADAGALDAGAPTDGGADAGALSDAGTVSDAGSLADAGASVDGGPSLSCVDIVAAGVGDGVARTTTIGAGDDFTSFLCSGESAPDLAVLFTAPASSSYRFDTFGSGIDTVLSLHDADCDNPKERACADDTGSQNLSVVTFYLLAGESVILNVDGFDADDAGDIVLNIAAVVDTCPGANLGSAIGAPVVTGVIDSSDVDTRTSSCTYEGGAADVSYAWVAPAEGEYTFAIVGAEFDSVLYLLDGGCDGFEAGCNDDSDVATEDSAITTRLTAGQAIIIVVDGFTEGELGSFELHISGPL